MLVVEKAAIAPRRGSILESTRVQALVGLLVAIVLPAIVTVPRLEFSAITMPTLASSMIAATTAYLLGLILLRRVTAFPGTRSFGFIIPSFATSFALAVALILSLRLDYSRLYMAGAFVMSLAVSFAISLFLERLVKARFYVVPYGDTGFIHDLDNVEWIVMSDPVVPADAHAAIVADLRYDLDDDWERMLAKAALMGHAVYHTKQVRESLTGRVSMDHLSENSFGSLLPNLAYVKNKRIFDVIGALAGLILASPVILLVAIAIRLDSPGPALFRQERMGFRGRTFTMVKFRSMYCSDGPSNDAEARLHAVTQSGDTRITRVGRFLRRTRLDELPQLYNVLLGQMSIIGPRPEAIALSRWYEAELPFYSYRHIVRPGITGWAQVNQGHVAELSDVGQKLTYDFYYIKMFSAWLDVLILLRTVAVAVGGFGAK